MIDKELKTIIDNECLRQNEGLEMIASENYTSEDVLSVLGSILTNKYSEGQPGRRYYGGNQLKIKGNLTLCFFYFIMDFNHYKIFPTTHYTQFCLFFNVYYIDFYRGHNNNHTIHF